LCPHVSLPLPFSLYLCHFLYIDRIFFIFEWSRYLSRDCRQGALISSHFQQQACRDERLLKLLEKVADKISSSRGSAFDLGDTQTSHQLRKQPGPLTHESALTDTECNRCAPSVCQSYSKPDSVTTADGMATGVPDVIDSREQQQKAFLFSEPVAESTELVKNEQVNRTTHEHVRFVYFKVSVLFVSCTAVV
jgi:hypothetical protein